ncbi:class I SAM-dependent methyltransferase [Roseomonas sp. CCTCC AB2023176]|uniref:class I SAM-dependent methyltransferase n=1 Tax=Roseomonas sp. CCTCC AB2023176 TaxID=3342640 RepID=UPI0035E0291F
MSQASAPPGRLPREPRPDPRAVARQDTQAYIEEFMTSARRFPGRPRVLADALQNVTIDGLFLEFGVAAGTSIRFLAARTDKRVYGFDSFQGLPEDWLPGAPKGQFRQEALPEVPENVELVVGLFDQTLPRFLASHPGPIAFLHVDCDLYSSTRTIFELCSERIVPGTVIVFDEYFNYPNWREHEFKAFQEFVEARRRRYEYLAMAPDRFQVSVLIRD